MAFYGSGLTRVYPWSVCTCTKLQFYSIPLGTPHMTPINQRQEDPTHMSPYIPSGTSCNKAVSVHPPPFYPESSVSPPSLPLLFSHSLEPSTIQQPTIQQPTTPPPSQKTIPALYPFLLKYQSVLLLARLLYWPECSLLLLPSALEGTIQNCL